ncbi:MAG: AIR synthase-related protein, partial [Candidatus Promineifilaceae bacterium]
ALSNGICPAYGEIDPYAMAWAAIDEAIRNLVAIGADPDQVAILDNFCWGNPNLPDRLGTLVRCAQGCYDAAVTFNTPFVSGKDSLNNEYTGADGQKHAILGTLLISATGIVPNADKTVTMDLKPDADLLYIVGDTRPELGGSHFGLINEWQDGRVPAPVPDAPVRFRTLFQAISADLIRACHDLSEGGLAVALAEMALAGQIGAEVSLSAVPTNGQSLADTERLYAESLSRFLVQIKSENAAEFESLLSQNNVPFGQIGRTGGPTLTILNQQNAPLFTYPISQLEQSWRSHTQPTKRQMANGKWQAQSLTTNRPITQSPTTQFTIHNSQFTIHHPPSPLF